MVIRKEKVKANKQLGNDAKSMATFVPHSNPHHSPINSFLLSTKRVKWGLNHQCQITHIFIFLTGIKELKKKVSFILLIRIILKFVLEFFFYFKINQIESLSSVSSPPNARDPTQNPWIQAAVRSRNYRLLSRETMRSNIWHSRL